MFGQWPKVSGAIMTEYIKFGPEDDHRLPHKSIGVILYKNLTNNQNNDRIAIVNSNTNEEISYKDLRRLVIQFAINLEKFGIAPGDPVAIVSENTSKYVIVSLALMLLGAESILLNPDYSINELRHFLTICKPKVIFSSTKPEPILQQLNKELASFKIIHFEDSGLSGAKKFHDFLAKVSDKEIANFQPADVDPGEVALILASSGTTGFPKGILLTHANIRTCMEYVGDANFLNITENEVVLNYLPFFHIFGCSGYLGAALFGAKMIVMEKFKPNRFLELIQVHKVTMLFTVPPILLFLSKTPLLENYDMSSVTDIVCGAAPVAKHIEDMVEKKLSSSRVRQMYGMTEVTGAVTVVPRNDTKKGSVGKVTTTHQIKIVDVETGKMLGPNDVGEICIKGGGVMKGYCNNEEETKAAFDDEGFFKSGDLGLYDEDDYFYVVDRLKELIKYKGFQVPPAELEYLIHQHPAVKNVGVVGVPDERAGELPLAFVVKKRNTVVTEDEIIRFVAENVSNQKQLHGGVRFVEEIPMCASGKILRRKLRELL